MPNGTSILIAAGEVSGDRQGAFLARAILRLEPGAKVYGAGGDEMLEAGVDVRLKTSALGSIGVQETLPYLGSLRRAYQEMQELVKSERPDVAVLIDNETFSMALARKLKAQHIPVIFYFPPQVTLWGTWRTRKVAQHADLIVAPFRTEVQAYRNAGARVVCVGHPLLDIIRPARGGIATLVDAGLDPLRPAAALLPGSRPAEIRRMAPVMLSAAQILKRRFPKLQIAVPLAATHCRGELERQISLAGMENEATVITRDAYTILSRCAVAVVKAGTSTLETALLSVPFVAMYRLSTLSYWVARMVVHTHFIAMPNILLGQMAVPEFCQADASAERVAAAAGRILEDPSYAASIRVQLERVREILGPPGAVDRVAALVLEEASRRTRGTKPARAEAAHEV